MSNRMQPARYSIISPMIRAAGSLVLVLGLLSGCQALPFLSTKEPLTDSAATTPTSTPTNASQPPAASTPVSTPGSQATSGSIPSPTTTPVTTPSIGSQALAKYRAARQGLRSEKMSHYWSVESNFPLKTGLFHREVNYDADGQMVTAWGSVEESIGVDVERSFWYRTETEYALVQDDELKRYPLSQVRDADRYDLDALVERILTDHSVTRETGAYYVRLTTQEEGLIRELLEAVGYRKTEADAYQGSLYLEAMLDETSGQLKTLNYVFTQRLAGYKDNGSILLSDFDVPVIVEIPQSDSLPTEVDPLDPSTVPAQP